VRDEFTGRSYKTVFCAFSVGRYCVVGCLLNYHFFQAVDRCSIPDDYIDPQRYAFFMAKSGLRECGGTRNSPVDCFPAKRNGVLPC
jgi:hypothetical protein